MKGYLLAPDRYPFARQNAVFWFSPVLLVLFGLFLTVFLAVFA